MPSFTWTLPATPIPAPSGSGGAGSGVVSSSGRADFGTDTTCTESMRTGRLSRGNRLVAEAIYRRLITRPGELIDDPTYGYDLTDLVGASLSAAEIASIPGRVKQEVLKDDRIQGVEVEAAFDVDTLTINMRAFTSVGPFDLVLKASQVGVEMVGFGS